MILRTTRKRRRTLLLLVLLLAGLLFWIFFYHPRPLVELLNSVQRRVVYRVDTDQPLVALTIDDGPSAELTDDLLRLLDRHGARATFFMIGEKAREHPELVARVRDAGHEIGNHMMKSGPPSVLLSTETFRRDLKRAEAILGIADGSRNPPRSFRPGSGWIRPDQLRVLEEEGYVCILGSVYPNDPKHGNPSLIRWFVLHKVQPGDIIILHEGGPRRRYVLDALEQILPELRRRGLEVVPVGVLLESADVPRGTRTATGAPKSAPGYTGSRGLRRAAAYGRPVPSSRSHRSSTSAW
ncbi:MAG: polysaccharide deacetylase family protein [Candidatus Krumholzibacteriia bacterium]